MVLISKSEKTPPEEFIFLIVDLTENGTLPWVFLIHIGIEIYCPCYQTTRSVAQYEF